MLALVGVAMLAALLALVLRPWRVEATLKATTHASQISVAAGLELAGLSGSAAAILGGPGVAAVHLRARELWRRSLAHVSLDALLSWLEERSASAASAPPPGLVGRLGHRAKDALLARTDLAELPELGVRVLLGFREVFLSGSIQLGSSDPAITGKAAAWLYPVAAVLAPFGTVEVSCDWTGRNVLDGTVETSFRVVPARVALEVMRFARHHVHLRRRSATASSSRLAAPAPASAPSPT